MPLNAILLRAPEGTSNTDKYEAAFSNLGPECKAVCVPVLETVLVNLEKLKEAILRKANVDGVILTSARSCEAWKAVVSKLKSEEKESWSSIPFYVVGAATASSLREIYPNGQIRGEQTGTAEQLARFIVEDLQSVMPKRLLYLTGDKNRDTLPKILEEDGGELESLQVYETCGSSLFPEDLNKALEGFEQDADFWITFFAPSAAELVYPHLQSHFRFRSSDVEHPSTNALPLARIAAIGPTTANFLCDTLRLHVDAVPAKPNPDALVKAIESHKDDRALNV